MKNRILTIIKNIGGAKILRSLKGDKITVLCIHRISDDFDFFFNPIRPKEFELLVNYCIKHYTVVNFSEIDKKTPKPKLIFSFDDGYYDFIENAVPILNKYKLPSNHNFVNACLNNNKIIWTQKLNDIFNHLKNNSIHNEKLVNEVSGEFDNNWWKYYISFLNHLFESESDQREDTINTLIKKYNIETNYRMMDWDDLKTCKEKYNVEIGSHTYNHESLNKVTDIKTLTLEIGDSINEIENNIQDKINIVSLPNGKFNESVLTYIKEKDVEFVLLVNNQFNKPSALNKTFNLINRVHLIQEPIDGVILRMEGLHEKLKRIL